MRNIHAALLVGAALLLVSPLAHSAYHVYRKRGTMECTIDVKPHDKGSNSRGRRWICLGHFASRRSAEKLFRDAQCKGDDVKSPDAGTPKPGKDAG